MAIKMKSVRKIRSDTLIHNQNKKAKNVKRIGRSYGHKVKVMWELTDNKYSSTATKMSLH